VNFSPPFFHSTFGLSLASASCKSVKIVKNITRKIMKSTHVLKRTIVVATISLTGVLSLNQPSLSQERSCSIANESNAACGKLTGIKKYFRISQSNQTKVKKQLVVTLQGCTRQSGNIKCDFSITNKIPGEDRRLAMDYNGPASRSFIIDSSGKSHLSSMLVFGEKISENGDFVRLVPDVEYAAALVFPDVAGSKVQVLRVGLGIIGDANVTFNNVPIAN
jgi:hypothetical protein